jgi:hypothetical protein
MSFSIDGHYWTAWEPFSSEKIYTLPPKDGEKSVYFRVMDRAGNIADPVHSSILLNTTETQSQEKAVSGVEIWYFSLAIIVILVLIIIGLVAILKRKKPEEGQLLLPKAVTIKPGALVAPTIISDQVTAAPTAAQLPGAVPVPTSAYQPPIPTISSTSTTPPMLQKAAQTTQTVVAQPIIQTIQPPATQLPQLPPAILVDQPIQPSTTTLTTISETTPEPQSTPPTTIGSSTDTSTSTISRAGNEENLNSN